MTTSRSPGDDCDRGLGEAGAGLVGPDAQAHIGIVAGAVILGHDQAQGELDGGADAQGPGVAGKQLVAALASFARPPVSAVSAPAGPGNDRMPGINGTIATPAWPDPVRPADGFTRPAGLGR